MHKRHKVEKARHVVTGDVKHGRWSWHRLGPRAYRPNKSMTLVEDIFINRRFEAIINGLRGSAILLTLASSLVSVVMSLVPRASFTKGHTAIRCTSLCSLRHNATLTAFPRLSAGTHTLLLALYLSLFLSLLSPVLWKYRLMKRNLAGLWEKQKKKTDLNSMLHTLNNHTLSCCLCIMRTWSKTFWW